MIWKTKEEPSPKKFKEVPSAGKIVATFFWDRKGIIMVEYLPAAIDPDTGKKYTVNANHYFDTLIKLRAAIKAKYPGLLSKGVILLHGNAKPHTAGITSNLLKDFKWKIFDHSAYSPDLAPSDFHLIPGLKDDLSDKRFANEKDLQAAVPNFFVKMDREWNAAGIEKLATRHNKCLGSLGNYAEK